MILHGPWTDTATGKLSFGFEPFTDFVVVQFFEAEVSWAIAFSSLGAPCLVVRLLANDNHHSGAEIEDIDVVILLARPFDDNSPDRYDGDSQMANRA